MANSSMLVLPRIGMPTALSLVTIVASYGGIQPCRVRDPAVVGSPLVVAMSFTAIGTPARMWSSSPPIRRLSMVRAVASAPSASMCRKAMTEPSTASMRSRWAWVASTALISLRDRRSASSAALARMMSEVTGEPLLGGTRRTAAGEGVSPRPGSAGRRNAAVRRRAPQPERRGGAGCGARLRTAAFLRPADPGRGLTPSPAAVRRVPPSKGSPVTSDIIRASAAELADRLSRKEISAVEATQAHLDRIEAVDGSVMAFLHIDAEGALATARTIDKRRMGGEELHILAGVPIAVKDIATTKGLPTTAGSRILQGWIPPYDATIVTKLKAAGMPILGKTNMDEFAMGSSTEHSAYGPTHNPWDLQRIPGGSGGGSSAAVAAFEAPLAIGTDTGGSIRQPAAVTGTVGCKPTYGGVSRYGLIALASSLDQIGPVSRTVLDAALLHEVIGGHDPRDSTSLD